MKHRRKIWNLDDQFHCSIIGTCLNLTELKRLGRKIGVNKEILVNDYRLHGAFVGLVGESSGAARLVNRHLDKKYREVVRHFAKTENPLALKELWREAFSAGEVAAAYWTLMTHPHVSEELLFHVHGQIHMLSHLSGASIRVDMQQLIQLRRRVPELEREFKAQNDRSLRMLEKKKETIHKLTLQLMGLQSAEKERTQLKEQLKNLEIAHNGDVNELQIKALEDSLTLARNNGERAKTEAANWKISAQEYRAQHEEAKHQLHQHVMEHHVLEQTLKKVLRPDCDHCENNDLCTENIDLCNRCILFVGGRNRQCVYFKALVERRNGQFIHHDGGLEENGQRLTALLTRADAVICPLDCISHDAVSRIKRDCKRHNKPLQMLPQSSLAAFTWGLHEVSAK